MLHFPPDCYMNYYQHRKSHETTKPKICIMKENTPDLKQISLSSFSGGIRNNGKNIIEVLLSEVLNCHIC